MEGCWGGLAASSEVSGNAGWADFAFLLVKPEAVRVDDDDDNWGRGKSAEFKWLFFISECSRVIKMAKSRVVGNNVITELLSPGPAPDLPGC